MTDEQIKLAFDKSLIRSAARREDARRKAEERRAWLALKVFVVWFAVGVVISYHWA